MEDLLSLSQQQLGLLIRDYKRKFIQDNPFSARMTILLGERGIGKSTSIAQYLDSLLTQGFSPKNILYLPADHFLLGKRALYEIAETFSLLDGKIICFDEIHKYLNWSQELKSIYDSFPQLKVIASGSSALIVQKGSHDLSRRAIVKKMYGFSFREFLELQTGASFPSFTLDEIINNHQELAHNCIKKLYQANQSKILAAFHQYLKTGYYPYFSTCASQEEFFSKLEQSAHATIESDIQSVYPTINGTSIKKIVSLLAILAQQVPFQPKMNQLTQLLELKDERTLKLYLKHLEDAGLITTVSKNGKGLSVLEKPEKIFFNNTNQIHAFGAQKTDIGAIRETYFVNAFSGIHNVYYSIQGDFIVKDYTFEVGGKNKKFTQIKDLPNAYLVVDDIEVGINNKIPLWLFGFLY